MATILAADIGGTKALVATFDDAAGVRELQRSAPASLRTRATASAANPVDLLLPSMRSDTRAACVAVAGAVIDGVATGSNLPWTVAREELESQLGVPVLLINDLHATAIWLPHLGNDQTEKLQDVPAIADGAIGLIAPGTGMGQATLLPCETGRRAFASEAGHIDFAPNNDFEADWWRFLHRQFGHVSLERACSGGAIPLLYEFVRSRAEHPADPTTVRTIETADPTSVIVTAALQGTCPAAQRTLEAFVAMLGAAAGNLALQVVATGGLYLAGGIAPRILEALRRPAFLAAFRSKGRFEYLVRRVPVRVVLEPRAPLLGAALAALEGAPQ